MKRPQLLLLVVLAGLALGCERVAVIKKCRALAQRVNPELESMAKSVEQKRDSKTYEEVAKRYLTLAGELEAFDAGAPEVNRAVADYAGTLRTGSQKVSELAQAVANGNEQSAAFVTRELEQEAKRQKSVAKRFQKECQGH